jgi:hypothetical protein
MLDKLKNFITKPLNLIIIVLFLGAILVLIFFQFKKSNFKQLSDTQMLFPAFSIDKQSILFFSNKTESGFYKYNFSDHSVYKISNDKIDTPNDITWSPDRKFAVLKIVYSTLFERYGSIFSNTTMKEGDIAFWLYNFDSKQIKSLDKEIADVIWSKDNNLVYRIKENKTYNIYKYTPQDNKKEIIQSINIPVEKLLHINNNGELTFCSMKEEGAYFDIYKSSTKQEPVLLFEDINIANLFISENGDYLVGRNKETDFYLYNFSNKNKSLIPLAKNYLNADFYSVLWLSGNEFIFMGNDKYHQIVFLAKITNEGKKMKNIDTKEINKDVNNFLFNLSQNFLYLFISDKPYTYKLK